MPKNLFEELEKSLKIYSILKGKFKKKFTSIPFTTLKANNFEEMRRVKKHCSPTAFLEKAYLLGFQRGKKTTNMTGRTMSEFQQAEDYINLLFCFDDAMHATITAVVDKKQKMKMYYKYINMLTE